MKPYRLLPTVCVLIVVGLLVYLIANIQHPTSKFCPEGQRLRVTEYAPRSVIAYECMMAGGWNEFLDSDDDGS
jgi:hypothetical protein